VAIGISILLKRRKRWFYIKNIEGFARSACAGRQAQAALESNKQAALTMGTIY